MIEKHPYSSFVPKNAKYLIIGSFPGRDSYDWYYGSKHNQFWKIMEIVYKKALSNIKVKKQLFKSLNIAITDITYSCERKHENNSDNNLVKITYNKECIEDILEKEKIKIYFLPVNLSIKLFIQFLKTLKIIYKNLINSFTINITKIR